MARTSPARRTSACDTAGSSSSVWATWTVVGASGVRASSSRAFTSASRPGRSTPIAGSSNNNSSLLAKSARASSTRWRSPCEQRPNVCSSTWPQRSKLEQFARPLFVLVVEAPPPRGKKTSLPGEHQIEDLLVVGKPIRDQVTDVADPRAQHAEVRPADLGSEHEGSPRRRVALSAENGEQRRLPGTVLAEQAPNVRPRSMVQSTGPRTCRPPTLTRTSDNIATGSDMPRIRSVRVPPRNLARAKRRQTVSRGAHDGCPTHLARWQFAGRGGRRGIAHRRRRARARPTVAMTGGERSAK